MPESYLPATNRAASGQLASESAEVLLKSLQARPLGAQEGGQSLGSDSAIGWLNVLTAAREVERRQNGAEGDI